jgi:hypothetical protein
LGHEPEFPLSLLKNGEETGSVLPKNSSLLITLKDRPQLTIEKLSTQLVCQPIPHLTLENGSTILLTFKNSSFANAVLSDLLIHSKDMLVDDGNVMDYDVAKDHALFLQREENDSPLVSAPTDFLPPQTEVNVPKRNTRGSEAQQNHPTLDQNPPANVNVKEKRSLYSMYQDISLPATKRANKKK